MATKRKADKPPAEVPTLKRQKTEELLPDILLPSFEALDKAMHMLPGIHNECTCIDYGLMKKRFRSRVYVCPLTQMLITRYYGIPIKLSDGKIHEYGTFAHPYAIMSLLRGKIMNSSENLYFTKLLDDTMDYYCIKYKNDPMKRNAYYNARVVAFQEQLRHRNPSIPINLTASKDNESIVQRGIGTIYGSTNQTIADC